MIENDGKLGAETVGGVGAPGVGGADRSDRSDGAAGSGSDPNTASPPSSSSSSATSAASAFKALLPTAEFAALLGVTGQTLLNYKAAGMPGYRDPSRTRGGKQSWIFPVEQCKAWIKSNKPVTGSGGRRPGSGRKPLWKQGRAEVAVVPGSDGADSPLARAAAAAPAADPEMEAALAALTAGLADGPQMRKLCGIVASRPMTRSEAEMLDQLSTTNERNRKNAVARGELVNADEVKAAYVDGLAAIRVRLAALPGRASAKVMAMAQLAGEKEPVIRAAIAGEVEAVIGEMGGAEENSKAEKQQSSK